MPLPWSPPPPDQRRLTDGGVVTLILGRGDDVPTDYGYHPRVIVVEASKVTLQTLDNKIPGNTRAVIIAKGEIHPDLVQATHVVVRRRRLTVLEQKSGSTDWIRQQLVALLGPPDKLVAPEPATNGGVTPEPTPTPTPTQAARGSLRKFVDEHLPALLAEDAQMPKAEAGRRLFVMAQRQGLKTTEGSLAQAVYTYKRDNHRGERAPSAQPPPTKVRVALAHALMALEAATEHVKNVQAEYDRVLAENDKLRKQQSRAAEVFKAFQHDVLGDNQGDD